MVAQAAMGRLSAEALAELMPSDEDLLYEEELLRNPYSLKLWWRYLDARKEAPPKRRYLLYERALKTLPGSYKVKRQGCAGSRSTHPPHTTATQPCCFLLAASPVARTILIARLSGSPTARCTHSTSDSGCPSNINILALASPHSCLKTSSTTTHTHAHTHNHASPLPFEGTFTLLHQMNVFGAGECTFSHIYPCLSSIYVTA